MKLSIITINRNNAEGIERTILSVIDQKFTNYEYIIIDGDSTDDSVEIIKKHSEHISFWVSEPDSGIYNAMNKAIKVATGEYLIFMNSGDCFISSDTLTNVFTENPMEDLLVGNTIMNWKRRKERRSIASKITFYNILSHRCIPHQATFTKRYLFDEIGFYEEEFKICADRNFFFLALFKFNKSFKRLNEDIALMDTTGVSSIESNFSLIKEEEDKIFQKYFPYFYADYKELYRIKRFTFKRLKRHIKWRLRKFIRG